MVLDQGQETLQPVVECGELPRWWFDAGGVVEAVDEYPSNGTDRFWLRS